MADQGTAPDVSREHHCTWCSADLADLAPDRCPACGAVLAGNPDALVPGVTTVDPAAVRRAARWAPAPKRRFFGLLGETRAEQEENGLHAPSSEALDLPSAEVRTEMLRLRAELEEAGRLADDAGLGGSILVATLPEVADLRDQLTP